MDPTHPNWTRLQPDAEQPWTVTEHAQLLGPPRIMVRDRVRTPAGAEFDYVYRPRGPQAVFVLPVTAEGEAVLIRQYRHPLQAQIHEVVAGGVEAGETLAQAAARELQEEVGGTASGWLALPAFYPQPSISGVVFYPLLALDVTLGPPTPEDSELIERQLLPLPEVYRRLLAGEIQDGPSSLVLFHARPHLEARGLL
ncbi:NUDIX hydrolase [Deinococcus sonorensis]|uniref:NUDIX hydrolase n=2 Tax=Deinococcus sonorensis TaxID=309891 RepID=A0AAU7UFB9_9DEIO